MNNVVEHLMNHLVKLTILRDLTQNLSRNFISRDYFIIIFL